MTTPTSSEITRLLVAWSEGDEHALERLEPLVRTELRRLAKRYLNKEQAGHTLQEVAEVLKISPRTVMREWSLAQAWLYRELRPGKPSSGGEDDR